VKQKEEAKGTATNGVSIAIVSGSQCGQFLSCIIWNQWGQTLLMPHVVVQLVGTISILKIIKKIKSFEL
jgi:hypothetical protein